MAEERNLRKLYEAIFGPELAADWADELAPIHWYPVGTYTEIQGSVTSRLTETTGEPRTSCVKSQLLDVSGRGRTGNDGKIEFHLSKFICRSDREFHSPINFLATPRSTSPVFLTSGVTFTSDRLDVRITVNAWDPKGAPAAKILFDWRCRVPYWPVID